MLIYVTIHVYMNIYIHVKNMTLEAVLRDIIKFWGKSIIASHIDKAMPRPHDFKDGEVWLMFKLG